LVGKSDIKEEDATAIAKHNLLIDEFNMYEVGYLQKKTPKYGEKNKHLKSKFHALKY